jgi:hypothetical protein
MPKVTTLSLSELLKLQTQNDSDLAFAKVLELMEKHGVCYCRFTLEDGVQIIDPRYNQRISGAIADA